MFVGGKPVGDQGKKERPEVEFRTMHNGNRKMKSRTATNRLNNLKSRGGEHLATPLLLQASLLLALSSCVTIAGRDPQMRVRSELPVVSEKPPLGDDRSTTPSRIMALSSVLRR
jgi:hypothetical protein